MTKLPTLGTLFDVNVSAFLDYRVRETGNRTWSTGRDFSAFDLDCISSLLCVEYFGEFY